MQLAGGDHGDEFTSPGDPETTGPGDQIDTAPPRPVSGPRPSGVRASARIRTALPEGPLHPGQTFGMRYHINRVLGVGGMGAVYHAWDSEFSVAVALERPSPEGEGFRVD